MTRRFATLLFVLSSLALLAQGGTTEPPADFMRSIGKMYVVVAVIVVVFLGIVAYLWSLDRRLSKLEDQTDDYA